MKQFIRFLHLPSRQLSTIEEREQASLLLKLFSFAVAATPFIALLHVVVGNAIPVILFSYSADILLFAAIWIVLYLLARTRYYRIAVYASVIFPTVAILGAYFAGNHWSLFYFVPILVLESFLLPPFQLGVLGAGYLILVVFLPQDTGNSFAFPTLAIILFTTIWYL